MAKEKSMEKCGCKPWMGLVALILAVIGFYLVIAGIKTQLASNLMYDWSVILYYLIGILLLAFAKVSKHKAFYGCNLHRMN